MLPIAQFGPADEWMPFVMGMVLFLIPIIAILTAHQRKMAEILHRNRETSVANPEIAALRAEVARLTEAVHQQTIMLDSLARQSASPPSPRLLADASQPQPLKTL